MLNYSQLEWISNGSNVTGISIDLNYYPSSATKIEVDAAFLTKSCTDSTSAYTGSIFGICANGYGANYFAQVGSSYLFFDTYKQNQARDSYVYDYTNYVDNQRRQYIFGTNYIRVGDKTSQTTETIFTRFDYSLRWFAGYTSTDRLAFQKLYEIKIYEDDVLVRDYIPVLRWTDRAIGLLDIISNEFYQASSKYFVRGKILDKYTENMELRVGFDEAETTHYYISEMSNNFERTDTYFGDLLTDDAELNRLVRVIENRFSVDAKEKEAIVRLLNNKVALTDQKDLVLNTLITKLDTDYSKDALDSTFTSNTDLVNKIATICNEILKDYYTKAEVEDLVEKGSGSKMDNYYTKAEIDEKIPDKEDLSIIQQFLESRTEYYNNLALFTKLNGKGE